MSTHGRNVFVPFPRYENAVFVGDSAIEALAELKIFGKALIGGELPNMQYFHPNEKLLECTSCVMQDQRVLTTAIRRGEIEYVLLENNPGSDINPALLTPKLEAEGVQVKILTIFQDPTETLLEIGRVFGEETRAGRIVREYRLQQEQLKRYSLLSPQSILALLAIRHPLDDRIFLFALSDASELSKDLYPALCAHNPIKEADYKTVIPGLVEIEDLSFLLAFNPDWIAITGDYLGIQRALAQFQIHERIVPDALAKNKVFTVPYYGKPLAVRRPRILKLWREAAEIAARVK